MKWVVGNGVDLAKGGSVISAVGLAHLIIIAKIQPISSLLKFMFFYVLNLGIYKKKISV